MTVNISEIFSAAKLGLGVEASICVEDKPKGLITTVLLGEERVELSANVSVWIEILEGEHVMFSLGVERAEWLHEVLGKALVSCRQSFADEAVRWLVE